jgi:hypothetical protein
MNPEARDSGLDAARRPGMTMQQMVAIAVHRPVMPAKAGMQ